MNRVGVVGFVVIFLAYLIWSAPPDQKREIVDTWFLFKRPDHLACIIGGGVLVLGLIVQQLHYKRVLGLNQIRIDEIAAEKTRLQDLVAKCKKW